MANDDKDPLNGFFEAAREAGARPSRALQARIVADADAVLAERARPAPNRGWVGNALDALGGWPTMAGLVTATFAGVWIGISPPALIETLMDVQTVEYLPGFQALLGEG